MTEKQIAKVQDKIKNYKKALARDKRLWGGQYRDGKGMRYAIPKLYIKIEDYKGALRYFNWFHKNFPDDSASATFFFEWSLTLFKSNKIKEAREKFYVAHFSNLYLFDKFFGSDFSHKNETEKGSWDFQSISDYFKDNHQQEEYLDFAAWISEELDCEKFRTNEKRFREIEDILKTERRELARELLVREMNSIKQGIGY